MECDILIVIHARVAPLVGMQMSRDKQWPGAMSRLYNLMVNNGWGDQSENRGFSFKHIEAETKWPSFTRRHFQMHFLNENILNLG